MLIYAPANMPNKKGSQPEIVAYDHHVTKSLLGDFQKPRFVGYSQMRGAQKSSMPIQAQSISMKSRDESDLG